MKTNSLSTPAKPMTKVILLLLFISFLFQFIISYDSYTHDLTEHYDSAWFFTCGKAWMNGMTPYIDFADSKGPLLWLIYGIGYLFSPCSYTGVFWLSVISYTVALYFTYRLASIFLSSGAESLLVTVLMLSAFFCPFYHTEIRAEDWCIPFVMATLYHICLTLYTNRGHSTDHTYKTCFVLGLSLAGTMLIKYNVTLMLGTLALFMLFYIIRERKNIVLSFAALLLGFLLLTAPFVVYMLFAGNLEAFVNEYFLNTFQTVQSYNSSSTYIREWLFLTYDTHYVLLFAIGCTGSWLMSREVSRYKYFFLISFIGFYAVAIHHSEFLHWHYLASCLPFVAWLCIALLRRSHAVTPPAVLFTVFISLATLISSLFSWGYLSQNLFFLNNETRRNYYNVASLLSKVPHSTITYYHTMDQGYGVPTNTLPATRYWATQKGATPQMLSSIHESIVRGDADFVFTSDVILPLAQNDSVLTRAGYHQLYSFAQGKNHFALYTKHPIPPLTTDYNVSNTDVLYKKQLFNIK